MLRAIASQPSDYYHAPSAADLPGIYKSIGANVIAKPVAAADVVVEHASDPAFEIVPGSLQPDGEVSGGTIVWRLHEVLDQPVKLSYRARPLQPGSFDSATSDRVTYVRCGAEDRTIAMPAGLRVAVAPPRHPPPP